MSSIFRDQNHGKIEKKNMVSCKVVRPSDKFANPI